MAQLGNIFDGKAHAANMDAVCRALLMRPDKSVTVRQVVQPLSFPPWKSLETIETSVSLEVEVVGIVSPQEIENVKGHHDAVELVAPMASQVDQFSIVTLIETLAKMKPGDEVLVVRNIGGTFEVLVPDE